MSRAIKFRSWRDGYMCTYYPQWYFYENNLMWEEYDAEVDNIGSGDPVLMQYTGVKDKNGKEIYEGDIVEIEEYGTGKVVFDEGMFQYHPLIGKWEIEPGISCLAIYPVTTAQVEVLGNIYENPELLTK